MDASFRPLESWLFPDAVLARFAPKSCSGFAWGPDGLMYASGHDRPEVYALRLPKAGATLELVATLPVPTEGQAIDWDPAEPRLLWSIDRRAKQLHSTRSEEHTSELQSLMRNSYAVLCLKKKTNTSRTQI